MIRGYSSTPMIGFDPAAARTEYGLTNNEIPVMLLAVGPMREGNWPSKPRRPVLDVLSLPLNGLRGWICS